MKKVTIMIPTYNQSGYIGQAIESAMEIDYPSLEIVISDDCSTDNTQEVVNQYLSDERVKYYKNKQNLGRVGNYRKTLYDYATGDYVLNLDGDDWLLETDFISKAVSLLEGNKNMSCVFGDRQNYNERKDQFKIVSNKNNPNVREVMDGNDFFINMLKIRFIFSHISCIYRRELALKLDFYSNDILSADSESIMKLYIGHKVGYLPILVGVWRSHELNATHLDIEEKFKNIQKFDHLYQYALEQNTYDKNTLDKWLFENKSWSFSQEVLYYLQERKIGLAYSLVKKIFFKDAKLGIKTLKVILKRLLNKVFPWIKLD